MDTKHIRMTAERQKDWEEVRYLYPSLPKEFNSKALDIIFYQLKLNKQNND